MRYHGVLVAFLARYVAVTVGDHLPLHLGQKIDQLESLLAIKAYAEPVYQKRGFTLKRQDAVGSWALRATTCPDNTQNCDSYSTAMLACCPKSTTCSSYAYRIACCATSARCDSTAATFPKCGDSSWTLWAGGRDGYFCCQSGEIGYITTSNGAACGPNTLKPTGTQVATSLGKNGGGDQTLQTSTSTGNSGSNTGNTSTIPSTSRAYTSPDPSITSKISSGTPDSSPTVYSQTQNPNSTNSSGSSGLPIGAIAGIAAGGVIILILAGVAIFFALKAGKRKGHAEAVAAFQQEQRNLPANNTYVHQSGGSTPIPPMAPLPPLPPQPHSQQTQWKSDSIPEVAETRLGPPNAPPPQWSAPTNSPDGPMYEADATTNIYTSSTHAEMDGYNNRGRY